MRLKVADLQPGTNYAVQVRAVREGQTSEWSERFLFTSVSNTNGPVAPTSVTWMVSDDAFVASWAPVSADSAGGTALVTAYEMEFTANTVSKIITIPAKTGSNIVYTLSYEQNVALFGTARPSVDFRVRAVNNKGVKGAWSATLNAANPRPAAPTAPASGAVAVGEPDSIRLTWTPPADTDLAGYNIYTGASAGFTPSAGNKIYSGLGNTFIYTTLTYTTQYFKIFSVDKFGQESLASLDGNAQPTSPFVVDTQAPNVPTGLTASLTNNANGIGAVATVSWTMNSPPTDLAGFYVRYRKGTDNWSVMTFAKDDRAALIDVPLANTAYEFQIKAFDWQSNESAWSSSTNASAGSNPPPADVTGLASTPGKDSIVYSWTPVADQDLKNYEVTFSTSPTFASGNTTFLTGTSTTLTVGGLNTNTTYYARVRAVDTAGQNSAAWSSTDTETTGTYPTSSQSDGFIPAVPGTPNLLGGLSYLYATWAPVTLNSNSTAQNDPVTYEVHLGTSSGFAVSAATKVTEVSGTSMVIDHLPGTSTPLSYATNYYVRLIAKDRDGSSAAGATSAAAQISKVASTDVTSIGADLIVPGTGFVNALVMASGGSISSSNYSAGSAGYRISTTGIEMNDSGSTIKADAIKAGTLGGASGSGVINIATGSSLVFNGGYLKSNTYTGTSQASNPSGAGFYLGNDGIRIDQGIISSSALTTGTISGTNTITLSGANAKIVGGTWELSGSGLSIPNGGIQAAHLNVQIGENIMPAKWADFEGAPTSYPPSDTWPATSNSSLAVATDTTQKYTNAQALKITYTGGSQNSVFLADTTTDYNIKVEPNSRYIVSLYVYNATGATFGLTPVIKQSNATTVSSTQQTVANTAAWTRYTYVITTDAGATTGGALYLVINGNCTAYIDAIQVEKALNSTITTASPYAPPGLTRIDGGIIRTGEIRSTNDTAIVNPTTGLPEPVWSIPLNGAATFSAMRVLGNTVIGNGPDDKVSVLQSSNYMPPDLNANPKVYGTGWRLQADGSVFVRTVDADNFTGNIIARNTDPTSVDGFGSTVELRGDGFFVKGSTAKGNPEYVTFPTTGAPNIISGTLQASTLNVNGLPDINGKLQGASFRGLSHIELAAEFTLDNQIGNPIAAPSATEYTPYGNLGNANVLWGLHFDASDSTFWGIAKVGSAFQLQQYNLSGNWLQTVTPQAPAAPNGAYSGTSADFQGLTKVGGSWYGLWKSTGAFAYVKYDASWNITTTVITAAANSYNGTMGNDGTNPVVVIWSTISSNAPFVYTLNPSTLAPTSTMQPVAGSWPVSVNSTDRLFGVAAGNFDYGSNTFLIGFNNNINGTLVSQIRAYDSSGNRLADREWPLEHTGYSRGFSWNGVAAPGNVGFYENGGLGLYSYTGTMWTNQSSVHGFAYSWYKVDGRTATGTPTSTTGNAILSAPAGTFKSTDVGAEWTKTSGSSIPANGKITAVAGDGTSATLDVTATATTSVTIQIAYETPISPILNKTMRKRRQVIITGASGPTGTVLRIYAGRNATVGANAVQTDMKQQTTLGPGFITDTRQVINFTGTGSKTPGTFAVGTPARMYSQQTYSYTVFPVTTSSTISPTIIAGTGAKQVFGFHMVGAAITGFGIQADTRIIAVSADRRQATLDKPATATGNNSTMTLTQPSGEVRGDGFANFERLYGRQAIFTSTQDVDTTEDNMPPVRIGDINGMHMRMDGNEVQVMTYDVSNALIADDLILNQGGGKIQLGKNSTRFSRVAMGRASTTTGPGGSDNISHGLNATPDVVIVSAEHGSAIPRFYNVTAKTSTNFTINVKDSSGANFQGSPVVNWIAFVI